jgi:hypothetical protein
MRSSCLRLGTIVVRGRNSVYPGRSLSVFFADALRGGTAGTFKRTTFPTAELATAAAAVGNRLFQPRIMRVRTDKTGAECSARQLEGTRTNKVL